jgi:hypothetical protein
VPQVSLLRPGIHATDVNGSTTLPFVIPRDLQFLPQLAAAR